MKIILLLISTSFYCQSYKVLSIHDGDTFTIIDHEQKKKVRLQGIDAPELAQEYGKESQQHLSNIIFNQEIKLVVTGKDKYGRILANAYLDTLWINRDMILTGNAWHYKKYSKDTTLSKAEIYAQSKKLGFWALNIEPAWIFRKKK
jgi:micrococcal nuclease